MKTSWVQGLDFSSDNPKPEIKNLKGLGLSVIAFVLAICGDVAQAQQQTKIHRIGYLSSFDQASESSRSEAIRLRLHQLGYIEGQNIATEYRYSEGKVDRLPQLAAELVRLKVNVIVAAGGVSLIRAAKNATEAIPIVMTGTGGDPVEAGLIESLARPGGNVTGITNLTRELAGKRLELLKEAVPDVVIVGVIYESDIPGSRRELKEVLPVAARSLALRVQYWGTRNADDFDKIFVALSKERPDGLYVTTSPLMTANLKRTINFASQSRLPTVGSNREYVDAGGFMSYDADPSDGYRRAATYVDKILKGVKPANLPVEQPTKFELVINLKTAKQIGLTIPAAVLARAAKVIK